MGRKPRAEPKSLASETGGLLGVGNTILACLLGTVGWWNPGLEPQSLPEPCTSQVKPLTLFTGHSCGQTQGWVLSP